MKGIGPCILSIAHVLGDTLLAVWWEREREMEGGREKELPLNGDIPRVSRASVVSGARQTDTATSSGTPSITRAASRVQQLFVERCTLGSTSLEQSQRGVGELARGTPRMNGAWHARGATSLVTQACPRPGSRSTASESQQIAAVSGQRIVSLRWLV